MPKKPKRTEPRHRSILAPQIQAQVAQIKAKEQRDKAEILVMKNISPFASSYLRKIEAREEVELLESLGLTGHAETPKRKQASVNPAAAAWTRDEKIQKLSVVIAATMDALELSPRVRLKILADCAERIHVQSRTKAQRVELRKAARRAAHGVVG